MASVYLDEDGWYKLSYGAQDDITTTVELGRSYVGSGPNYYVDENKLYAMDYSNYYSEVIVYIVFWDGTLISKNNYESTDFTIQHHGFLYILCNNYSSNQAFIYRDNVLIWQIDGVIVNPNDIMTNDDNISFIANSDRYLIGIDGNVKHVQE